MIAFVFYSEDAFFAAGILLGIAGWCLLWRAVFR